MDREKRLFQNQNTKPKFSVFIKNHCLLRVLPLFASCLWLLNENVIDDSDYQVVNNINMHRNSVSHELIDFIAKPGVEVDLSLLDSMYALVSKIDRWWIRYFEIPGNSDYDDIDSDTIPDSEITSGNMMLMNLLVPLAYGDDSNLKYVHEKIMEDERIKSLKKKS